MAVNPDFNPGDITDDSIVNDVIKKTIDRHMQGMEKFGKTMSDNKRPMSEWADELIEELLDAVHYLTKMKSIFQQFDNDSDKVKAALKSLQEKTSTNDKTETQS